MSEIISQSKQAYFAKAIRLKAKVLNLVHGKIKKGRTMSEDW
jgi:hypothetical protein